MKSEGDEELYPATTADNGEIRQTRGYIVFLYFISAPRGGICWERDVDKICRDCMAERKEVDESPRCEDGKMPVTRAAISRLWRQRIGQWTESCTTFSSQVC